MLLRQPTAGHRQQARKVLHREDSGQRERAADDQNLCRAEEARDVPIHLGHPHGPQRQPMPDDVEDGQRREPQQT